MKNLKWVLAICTVLIVMVAAGTAAATSALIATPQYPATCKKVVSCVDNHLNNLNTRVHTQHGQIVALENQVAALQDQVAGLPNQVAGLQNQVTSMSNQVTSMSNQLGCYGTLKVAQYPHSLGTSNGDLTPASGGTWLDLMRPDNPANNQVFPLVLDSCVR